MFILKKRFTKKLNRQREQALSVAEKCKRDQNDSAYWYWTGRAEAIEALKFDLETWGS